MQIINLYQGVEKPKKIFLSLSHMLKISAVFFLILLLASGYMFHSNYASELELIKLQNQQKTLDQGLVKAQDIIPTEEDRKKIIKEIEALEKARVAREKMYRTLNQLQDGSSEGFSGYFKALSKHSVPGLWFTNIKIASNDSNITLEGDTIDGEFVPKLINNLGQDKTFRNKTFKLFKMLLQDDNTVLHFTLGT